ncbi:MAG: hypothetical protein AAF065_00215 [Verrucomicrobiota bacterium]
MLVVLPNTFGDAFTNMAIDAALLDTIPSGAALFRHYGWTEPSITFGYSQQYEEVMNAGPKGTTLCRRATGGGIVDHRDDWTYSLILQSELDAAQGSSTSIYENVHRSIASTLLQQSVETRLAPCPRKCEEAPAETDGPDQCFIQPVINDVLTADGRKIAGAAMKRTRKGLLIQGSIDRAALPETLDFQSFRNDFIEAILISLKLTLEQPEDLRLFFSNEAIQREKEKFSSSEWIERR